MLDSVSVLHEKKKYEVPYLLVVHKLKPRDSVCPESAVSRVSRSDALHVWSERRYSVERLPLLDLVDHLTHIHLDLAGVLLETVEAHCNNSIVSLTFGPEN